MIAWYFGFYPAASIGEIRKGAPWTAFWRHVEAWACNDDDTWLFFDPRARITRVEVMHRHDDVVDTLAVRYELCETIFRLEPAGRQMAFPFHMPMNCVTQCAALAGMRAFTPKGFERTLLRNGAEKVHDRRSVQAAATGFIPNGEKA